LAKQGCESIGEVVGGDWCTTLGSAKGYVWMLYETAAGYLLVTSAS